MMLHFFLRYFLRFEDHNGLAGALFNFSSVLHIYRKPDLLAPNFCSRTHFRTYGIACDLHINNLARYC